MTWIFAFLIAALMALPALAAGPDLAHNAVAEWNAGDVAHRHTEAALAALARDYERQKDDLKTARDLAAYWEEYARGIAPWLRPTE